MWQSTGITMSRFRVSFTLQNFSLSENWLVSNISERYADKFALQFDTPAKAGTGPKKLHWENYTSNSFHIINPLNMIVLWCTGVSGGPSIELISLSVVVFLPTLRKLYFQFLPHWMRYDRGDGFSYDFEPNGFPFSSKSKEKPSPRSYPIQCERK